MKKRIKNKDKTFYWKASPKGPRFKKTPWKVDVVTRELFKNFRKDYPEFKSTTFERFRDIWRNIIAPEIRHEWIHNPLGIKLPYYIGELKLNWVPYKNPHFPNMEYGGKTPKIAWERRNAVRYTPTLQFFGMEPCRLVEEAAKKKARYDNKEIRVAQFIPKENKFGMIYKDEDGNIKQRGNSKSKAKDKGTNG